MDFLFFLYVALSSILLVGGSFLFYSGNRPVTTFLYFGGMLAAVILFGTRWFLPDGSLNLATVKSWPPVLNTCPDYMSLTKIGDKQVCVDTVGISSKSGIKKWTSPNQTTDDYIFNLYTDKSGSDRIDALCQEAKAKVVTWEGVYDGVQCLNNEPPKPAA